MSLKVWEIYHTPIDQWGCRTQLEVEVEGPPTNGPTEVVEKAEYDKLKGALQRAVTLLWADEWTPEDRDEVDALGNEYEADLDESQ